MSPGGGKRYAGGCIWPEKLRTSKLQCKGRQEFLLRILGGGALGSDWAGIWKSAFIPLALWAGISWVTEADGSHNQGPAPT